MNQIADFNCDVGAMRRITPELLTAAGSSFPAAYLESGDMAKTALELKRENNACFCMLPFCHTLEAEATGGIIHFDDVETGPRFGDRPASPWMRCCKCPRSTIPLAGWPRHWRPAACCTSRGSM